MRAMRKVNHELIVRLKHKSGVVDLQVQGGLGGPKPEIVLAEVSPTGGPFYACHHARISPLLEA